MENLFKENTKIINMENIIPHKMSTGAVFYDQSGRLYVSFNSILPNELLEKLPVQKLKPTNFKHNNKDVFELKEYKHRIRIQECTKDIVKEFIYAICDFHIESIQHNVFLTDIHEANINYTHDGVLWIDVNSMRKVKTEKQSKKALLLTYYFVQKYLYDKFDYDYTRYDFKNARRISKNIDNDPFKKETWEKVKEEVLSFKTDIKGGNWYHNYSKIMDIDNPDNVNEKAVKVAKVLETIDFKTVTDVGCNKGYYSLYLANKKKCETIGFDLDEKCVQSAIELARDRNLNSIFAVKDIPLFCKNKIYEFDRFSSELVIALAITHHMKNLISVKEFSNALCSISSKYILIEDIVNREEYEKEFKKNGFDLIKRVDSFPVNRKLSLYQRKVS